jgi:hypothetical protein
VILALAVAFAAGGVIVVMPRSGGPDEAAVARTLARADLGAAELVDGSAFTADVVVAPAPRTRGDDCLQVAHMPQWTARLDAARRRYDLLDAEGSLADLVLLDLELACLVDPMPAATLVSLDVARAEAHLLLAAASEADLGQAAFHGSEAARALDRVVAVGAALVPAEASPELLDALRAAETRRRRTAGPWVAAALPSGTDELRLNGRAMPVGGLPAVEGENLLQRVGSDGTVRGASRLSLRAGEDAVIVDPAPEASLPDLVEGLARRAPTREDETVLAALAAARARGSTVVYAGWVGSGPAMWRAMGRGLVRLEVPRAGEARQPEAERVVDREAERASLDAELEGFRFREEEDDGGGVREPEPREMRSPRGEARVRTRPAERRWRATAGIRVGGGWREEGDGGAVGVGLAGRVAVAPVWAVAWSVLPEASLDSLDPAGSGVEARAPVCVGARWGEHGAAWAFDVGPDVGAVWMADGTVRPSLGGCGSASTATGERAGFRFELCADTDLVGAGVDVGLGWESRL